MTHYTSFRPSFILHISKQDKFQLFFSETYILAQKWLIRLRMNKPNALKVYNMKY